MHEQCECAGRSWYSAGAGRDAEDERADHEPCSAEIKSSGDARGELKEATAVEWKSSGCSLRAP